MLNVRKIRSSDDPFFEKAMAIYEAAFPANQRHPMATIKERLDNGQYFMFLGQLEGEPALMALFWPLKGAKFVLFDYMAVAEKFQGQGIGKEFVTQVPDLLGTDLPLVLEVEAEGHGESPARRVKFHKGMGARTLKGVRYMLPPLSAPGATEMTLMVMNWKEDSIPGLIVKRLIRCIYKELYSRGSRDSLLRTFIDKVPEDVKLV